MSKCDSREPQWKKDIFRRAGWIIVALKHGDYQIDEATGKLVGVEHKTVKKLVGDMVTGTLTRQCRTLCENVDFPILMVEGHWAQRKGSLLGTGFTWEEAWNQLETIQDMGCRLQLTTSGEHSIERIFELEKYYRKESHPSALRQPSGNPYITTLTLIPGVGVEKAKEIEKIYPTIRKLCEVTPALMATNIPGIGDALATRVWQFLRGVYV